MSFVTICVKVSSADYFEHSVPVLLSAQIIVTQPSHTRIEFINNYLKHLFIQMITYREKHEWYTVEFLICGFIFINVNSLLIFFINVYQHIVFISLLNLLRRGKTTYHSICRVPFRRMVLRCSSLYTTWRQYSEAAPPYGEISTKSNLKHLRTWLRTACSSSHAIAVINIKWEISCPVIVRLAEYWKITFRSFHQRLWK